MKTTSIEINVFTDESLKQLRAERSADYRKEAMGANDFNFDELLRKSTVRGDLPLNVTGNFPSDDDAQKLLYTVLGFARVFGSVFDLTALDGITIADDYVAALAAVDRGYTLSTDERLQGSMISRLLWTFRA